MGWQRLFIILLEEVLTLCCKCARPHALHSYKFCQFENMANRCGILSRAAVYAIFADELIENTNIQFCVMHNSKCNAIDLCFRQMVSQKFTFRITQHNTNCRFNWVLIEFTLFVVRNILNEYFIHHTILYSIEIERMQAAPFSMRLIFVLQTRIEMWKCANESTQIHLFLVCLFAITHIQRDGHRHGIWDVELWIVLDGKIM